MVPHMVAISWRQIKNRIPLDFARLQTTNEPRPVGSGTLLGSSVWSEVRAGLTAQSTRICVPAHRAVPMSKVTTADALAVLTPI